MSVCIVEGRQRRPGPPTAACGGNGGRARWARRLAAAAPEARYRGPGSAATRRELSRAIIAVFTCRRETRRVHSERSAAWVLLGSAIVRLAKLARPRMRAIASLLVVDDAHRHRLPPRALRSPHFHSPILKFARSGTLRVNTHARDRLYFHHGLLSLISGSRLFSLLRSSGRARRRASSPRRACCGCGS